MADPGVYGGHIQNWGAPAFYGYAATSSNTVAGPNRQFRATYVGSTGQTKAAMANGTDVEHPAVPVVMWPFARSRALSTWPAAASIVGLV